METQDSQSSEQQSAPYSESRSETFVLKFLRGLWHWADLRDKTLWDWMTLLIFPTMVGIGAVYLEARIGAEQEEQIQENRRLELEIAADRYRQTALSEYFDQVTQLLLTTSSGQPVDKGTGTAKVKSETTALSWSIIRSRTITTLRELDGRRKGLLVQFLWESNLISGSDPLIPLDQADLREADLRGVNLYYANLQNVDLRQADLQGADLSFAYLQGADLRESNLRVANLQQADLKGAKLSWSNLSGAQLFQANLFQADLSQADLSGTFLAEADLTGATMLSAFLEDAYLREVNFREANLFDANLLRAFLSDDDLKQALLCGTTTMSGEVSERDCIQDQVGDITAVPITDLANLLGEYLVDGTNPNGSKYRGFCLLEPGGDDTSVQIIWTIASGRFQGTGRVTKGGNLYVSYLSEDGFAGDAIFSLTADGSVQGIWRPEGSTETGTETWKPKPAREL